MTQDIIEMARQANATDIGQGTAFHFYREELEAFAKLVAEAAAAKEREEFAVHAVDIARRAVAEEREACAKLCDDADKSTHPSDLADAIRARGEA